MVRKYGKDDVEGIHHWVTQEVRSTRGDLQLRADLQVPEDFQYMRPDGTMIPKAELVRPMSNYDYESGLNDYKRGIHVLKPQFLNAFVEEFEDLVEYLPSNEVDPLTGIKRSVDTVAEAFTSVKPTYQTLVGQIPSIQFAATAEYTSRNFGSTDPTISEGDVLADGSTVAVTTGNTSATTETAGSTTSTETNQYGSAGSSSGQTSGSGGSSGGTFQEGPPMVVEEDTKSVLSLLLDVAILSNYPHVALLARFVGILLLDRIRFQTLFGQNADLGDIQEIRLLVI